jgi:hypothetical protein
MQSVRVAQPDRIELCATRCADRQGRESPAAQACAQPQSRRLARRRRKRGHKRPFFLFGWGIDASESDQLCRGDDCELYRPGAEAAAAFAALFNANPGCSFASRPTWTSTVGPWVFARWEVQALISGIGSSRRRRPRLASLLQWQVRRRSTPDQRGREGIWSASYMEPRPYRACSRANGAGPIVRTIPSVRNQRDQCANERSLSAHASAQIL